MSPLQLAKIAFENRESDARARRFPVATQTTEIERELARLKRNDAKIFKTLMKPKNADAVLDVLPAREGETLHAVISGDFVFHDMIFRLVNRIGAPLSMTIATLSLSLKTLLGIEAMFTRFPGFPLTLVVSSYFQSSNKDIFAALEALATRFADRFKVTIGRSHAKIILIDYGPSAGCYIIETSSNLRSSNNLEHLTIFRERQLFDFHAGWIQEFCTAKAEE